MYLNILYEHQYALRDILFMELHWSIVEVYKLGKIGSATVHVEYWSIGKYWVLEYLMYCKEILECVLSMEIDG